MGYCGRELKSTNADRVLVRADVVVADAIDCNGGSGSGADLLGRLHANVAVPHRLQAVPGPP